jgi:hypothetical protein
MISSKDKILFALDVLMTEIPAGSHKAEMADVVSLLEDWALTCHSAGNATKAEVLEAVGNWAKELMR